MRTPIPSSPLKDSGPKEKHEIRAAAEFDHDAIDWNNSDFPELFAKKNDANALANRR